MSKLIDGKYTMGMPFATGIQYITSDEVRESDTHHTLSTALIQYKVEHFKMEHLRVILLLVMHPVIILRLMRELLHMKIMKVLH